MSKKLTQEEFIEKAIKVHGNKYDYSLVEYINTKTKIKIICKEHGEFLQVPNYHLSNCGCPLCSSNIKLTTEDFIKLAKEKHNNKYDYKLTNYININSKVKIICKEHGEFNQTPNWHLKSYGCIKCSKNNIKLTTEDFIKLAKEKHDNKYDYKLTNYINNNTNIKIICEKHGEYLQLPYIHLKGCGCPKCGGNKKLTQEEFVEKAKNIHGNKYNYSLVEYINTKTNIKIICKKHGEYLQLPYVHLRGNGCSKCSNNCKKYTTEEFIVKANIKHNNKFDYSLVEYVGSKNKIKIICKEHGEFLQLPNVHLNGFGCAKCSGTYKYTTEEFIVKANIKHNNKFDYSLVNYINSINKIKIICKEHGEFLQSANSHLDGFGCAKCSGIYKYTTEEFIVKANIKHNNKFDYSLVNYINCTNKIKIICKEHGEFLQLPRDHLHGYGCQKCGQTSKGETKIEKFLEEYNFKYILQHKFNDCKHIFLLRFDFYLPKYNICIEYDGIQHYKPIKWFGGEKAFIKTQIRDEIKTNYCKENNIHLIRISYNENIIEKLEQFFIQKNIKLQKKIKTH
jgi:very-short-patch-repair endonuclease